MQMVWRARDRLLSFLPTTSAMRPEMPMSISSKMRTCTGSDWESTDFRASMIRDTSPPEATLTSGLRASPGFVEMWKLDALDALRARAKPPVV